jgi:tRNA 2-thiouridine synthesizing protein A
MTTQAPALRIDALGKKCPLPIIMLAERIGEVAIGNVVEVIADDPATRTDVPAWCGLKSHEFISATDLAPNEPAHSEPTSAAGWAFRVRRSY